MDKKASSSALCVGLPTQHLGLSHFSACTVHQPVVIIEKPNDNGYTISVSFQLNIAGTTPSDEDHQRYMTEVNLCYKDRPEDNAEKKPISDPGRTFQVTTNRTVSGSVQAAFNSGTPPSGSVNLSLTWQKGITVERQVDRWSTRAVDDPIKQNTFTWTWKANIPDNASPLPSDLSTSTEWCVLVKRHVPPEEDLVEFAGRPFEFDLEAALEERGSRVVKAFRNFFTRHYGKRLARSKWKFSIALSDTKDGTGFPTTGTIDIQSALADLKAVEGDTIINVPAHFPDHPDHNQYTFNAMHLVDGFPNDDSPLIEVWDQTQNPHHA